MEIGLRHLRAVVAVAEERHFGRAAERLHIAQPPLSRQVRDLEEELGAELFDRSRRPVRLTAAGEAFLGEAKRGLDQVARAVDRGRRAGRGELGRLSIAALPWAHNGILPPVVSAFRARAPDVYLELSTQAPGDQAEALRNGRLDIGFAGFAHWLAAVRGLEVEPLLEEPFVAMVADDHPLARRTEVSLEQLASEPFVSISRAGAPELSDVQAGAFSERGLSPTLAQEAPDPEALLGLIAAGVGVGLHMASFANLRRRGVTFLPLADAAPTATLFLLWRRGEAQKAVRIFVDTAREVARACRGSGDAARALEQPGAAPAGLGP